MSRVLIRKHLAESLLVSTTTLRFHGEIRCSHGEIRKISVLSDEKVPHLELCIYTIVLEKKNLRKCLILSQAIPRDSEWIDNSWNNLEEGKLVKLIKSAPIHCYWVDKKNACWPCQWQKKDFYSQIRQVMSCNTKGEKTYLLTWAQWRLKSASASI